MAEQARILVIDDEAEIAEVLAEILEAEGYAVSTASDGDSGVRLARDLLPDLILCDVMMPGLDGFSVVRELRRDPATTLIPLVFLTARREHDDVRRGMDLGADDYLTKPVAADELLRAISSRLAKHEAMRREGRRRLEELRRSIAHSLPHEFLTPLTAVIGLGGYLRENAESLERREIEELAATVLGAGERLQELSEKFLAYIELRGIAEDVRRGAEPRRGSTPDPTAVLAPVVAARARAEGREAEIQVTTDGTPAPVDAEHLRLAARELVENSLRFSSAGSGVRAHCAAEAEGWTLSVTDRGRGMTAEQVAAIGPYLQFGRRTHEQPGVGLGLGIVQEVACLYGGQLSVESVPGSGTRARLLVPLRP